MRARRIRLGERAARTDTPCAPVVWHAGWRGRMAGAASCLLFVTQHPAGTSVADPRPGALFLAAWVSLVAGWLCCRLAMWRITADRDGVYIRRMWTTKFLSWSVISRVDLRHDGLLEFLGPGGCPMAGLFAPLRLSRATRRPTSGVRAADSLTVMARHAALRPTVWADARTRPAFARWALPLGIGLFLASALVHV